MKKLMTALAICAVTGFALAADTGVASANIVGYIQKTSPGKFFSSGSMFISVGNTNKEWRLGDVSATGMDPNSDIIEFLSAATADTILSATYIDLPTAIGYGNAALQGWWDLDLENRLDDTMVKSGTGFLSNFGSSGVKLTYAGEVVQRTNTLDLSGMKFVMVANCVPVDLTLSNLTCTGMDPNSDIIEFLSAATADTILSATYIDLPTAIGYGNAALLGWWDLDLENRLDSQPLPAGTAFLTNLGSPNVTIKFPSPVN